MDLEQTFGTDKDKEVNGTWFPVGDGKVLIARQGNPNYAKRIRKLYAENEAAISQAGLFGEENAQAATIEIVADTILLGWENFTLGGKKIDYNRENAIKLLTDYKDFRDFVARCATQMEAFKREVEDKQLGNSDKRSSGTSTGQSTKAS